MIAATARYLFSKPIVKRRHFLSTALRSFSVLENKLALLDLFGDNEDDSEYDRNGVKLPPFGSIISYTAQRQYHVGIYEGSKMLDGIQKLQIRNEHECLRDVSDWLFS